MSAQPVAVRARVKRWVVRCADGEARVWGNAKPTPDMMDHMAQFHGGWATCEPSYEGEPGGALL